MRINIAKATARRETGRVTAVSQSVMTRVWQTSLWCVAAAPLLLHWAKYSTSSLSCRLSIIVNHTSH